MRELDILVFLICFSLALPIVTVLGVFGTMPEYSWFSSALLTSGLVAALVGGGITVLGLSFKLAAVVTTLASIFMSAATFASFMLKAIIDAIVPGYGTSIAATFYTFLLAIGGFCLLKIAGGVGQ